jgi:hypothetical protein
MNFNFKTILSNVFGSKEKNLQKGLISQLQESIKVSQEKVTFLQSSKDEVIKAFDKVNDETAQVFEKASQDEDKESIQRRFNRYERNFFKELADINQEIQKAESDIIDFQHQLNLIINPSIEKAEVVAEKNYFEHLSFDTNVESISFQQVCEMLTKAIDMGALTERRDAPIIVSEEDYIESAMTLATAKEEGLLKGELLEKAIHNLSHLTPTRIQVTTRDGRVYTKTVYKKFEEKTPEKAATFLDQQAFEHRMSEGDLINAHFKGWSSGTSLNASKLKITEIHPDHIVAKFIDNYTSPTGYTYGPNASLDQGKSVKLPRTSSPNWNQSERFSEWVDPAIERDRARQAELANATVHEADLRRLSQTHEVDMNSSTETATDITHENQIHNGDAVRFTKDNQLVDGRVKSVWRQADGKGRLTIALPDGTQIYKQIPPTRGGKVEKVVTGQSVQTTVPGAPPVVRNPSTMDSTMIRNLAAMRLTGTSDMTDGWVQQYNEHFPNLDLGEMVNSLSNEIRAAGVQRLVKSITVNPRGAFVLLITGTGGFKLERNFRTQKDFTSPTQSEGGTSVYHAYFKVGSDVNQGGGLGKKIFRILNKQYRRAGITELEVSANITSGAYAWGRYGFTATKNMALEKANAFAHYVGREMDIDERGTRTKYTVTRDDAEKAKKVVEDFYRNNPETTRFPMDYICQINGGKPAKIVMNGNNWKGFLNLKDPIQRDRFESYIQY